MIARDHLSVVEQALHESGCVLLLGPYEVGKTSMAREVASRMATNAIFLDLRRPEDRARLCADGALIRQSAGKLIVLDEIHCMPEAFDFLHSELEAGRHESRATAQFLILGSGSLDTGKLAATRLGTRAHPVRLPPIQPLELPGQQPTNFGDMSISLDQDFVSKGTIPLRNNDIAIDTLWLRGGFPTSLLAESDSASFQWRSRYLDTCCNRDLSHLGAALSAASVRRFLETLATNQGELLNVSSLPVEQRPCLGYFDDLGLVRQLQPWSTNELKRLEKNQKMYVRDSGLLHCLLRRRTLPEVRGDARVFGHSWEGFCIESLIMAAGDRAQPYFFRSRDGDEVDLVLEFSAHHL